jgi:hypothetical protein
MKRALAVLPAAAVQNAMQMQMNPDPHPPRAMAGWVTNPWRYLFRCVRGMVERFDLFDDPCSPEKPGRVGTLVLQRLLFQGPEGEERAWELYNEMLQSGEANEYHATAMLKV